jgi:hypothetical protein
MLPLHAIAAGSATAWYRADCGNRSLESCKGIGWQSKAPAPHALQCLRQQGRAGAFDCQPSGLKPIPEQGLRGPRRSLPSDRKESQPCCQSSS